ncbi:peptidylprolyl isomerase [Sphingobium fontiphilum]|uniref:Peptidylprolyl isomerase n=1 Tax=Sphingobium fontiphilum TaxID=944425 RepID=A0A7W6DEQ3_9SPHN|nr:peptidylprolyl isomerase [Sphingobium fontiphilum]MBB3981382.1 peptidylprolyl isomerase [Sphingobium fontiphilum]
MRFHSIVHSAVAIALAATFSLALAADGPPVTPAQVVDRAPASHWRAIAPDDLLVMDLGGGRRVVIQIAPTLSPAHVANMRVLARAHWWDGTSINRVQDNYVVQWGDATEEKPMPPGMAPTGEGDYVQPMGLVRARITALPYADSYAPKAGFVDGWPVAADEDHVWLPHCYGFVGVGRNMSPDAGTGAELYAVIGQAPRQLDRNIAVVGRVIAGIEHLSSLPRGSGPLGFYKNDEKRVAILSVRLASELPDGERPRFEAMDTGSASFADYLRLRANRKDDFYIRPAGGVDLCNAPVPVRPTPQDVMPRTR